jgi:hypothetical protein
MEEDWARIEAELNHTNEIRETKYLFMIFFAGKGTRIIRALQYLKIMKKLTNEIKKNILTFRYCTKNIIALSLQQY